MDMDGQGQGWFRLLILILY